MFDFSLFSLFPILTKVFSPNLQTKSLEFLAAAAHSLYLQAIVLIYMSFPPIT